MKKRRSFLKSAYKHPVSGGTCLLQVEGTAAELGHIPNQWGQPDEFEEEVRHAGKVITVCNFWRSEFRDGETFPMPLEIIQI